MGYTKDELIEGLENTNRILGKQLDKAHRRNNWIWFQWFTIGIIFGMVIGSFL